MLKYTSGRSKMSEGRNLAQNTESSFFSLTSDPFTFGKDALYPAALTASIILSAESTVSSYSAVITFSIRLTFTSFMPSSGVTAFSTAFTHIAQAIPFISNVCFMFIPQIIQVSLCLSVYNKKQAIPNKDLVNNCLF